MFQVVHTLILRTEKVEGADDRVAGEDKKKSKYNGIYGAECNHDPDGVYECGLQRAADASIKAQDRNLDQRGRG
jgi:hypothetical protein